MRLIDVDKYLEKVCTYKETGCGSCKLQTMCPKDAPTVKAIPVEWVEKWVDILKERNYHSYQVLMPVLIEMLEEWEKENETNVEC